MIWRIGIGVMSWGFTLERELTVPRRSNYIMHVQPLCMLLALLLCQEAIAQHTQHDMNKAGAGQVRSMPGNDEVLATPPASIMLHFDAAVMLVKLVLRDPSQSKEPIDIGFRYQPERQMNYAQPLPELASANYYVVEWAAFDASDALVKGVFYFSFGDNAKPPSYYLNQIQHPDHIMSPDFRLL